MSGDRRGWPRRVLIAVAIAAATAFVGASIVIATVAGPGHRDRAAANASGPYASAPENVPSPPSAAVVRARLASSPPALAALHRQGHRLLGGDLDRRLRRLRGDPVVLNEWASWCAPCRQEMPLFSRASAAFGRRVAFVGADVDDADGGARSLLRAARPSYPSYRSSAAALRALTPIVGFPTTVYLDRRGHVVFSHQGQYASEGELAADVRRYALGG